MSAANAKTALGAQLKAVASGGSLAVMGALLRIDPPKLTRGVIEASDLSTTGGMEYIQEGLYDIGQLSGAIHWLAGSTNDDLMVGGVVTGGLFDFEIVVKASSGTEDMNFSGYWIEVGGEPLEIGGKQGFAFTIKPSGDFVQAASV